MIGPHSTTDRRSRARSFLALTLFALVAFIVPSGTAVADPAGPTDYLTEIVSVEPAVETVELRILGGDSFLELEATLGTEVTVSGYQGEPYLWFRADGTVVENRNAPTTYLNEERFGNDFPDFADADAAPDWSEVADDGSYAWHDHRAHWMQTIRPAGKAPGDQILEAVVPLVVDGVDVDVTVSSYWQPEPSRVPFIAGVVGGVIVSAAAWLLAERRQRWTAVLVPVALLATVVGWIHYTSLPAETGTPPTTWALPATALLTLGAASVVRPKEAFWVSAGSLIGGAQLVLWTWIERDGIGAAILPTTGPDWLHRLTVSLAGVAGIAALVVGGRQLARLLTPTSPSSPSGSTSREENGTPDEFLGTLGGQTTT